ncbi:MAG: hypothetical protein O3B47_03295 [bacterium]|nr:hypothetical protein [bacterium]
MIKRPENFAEARFLFFSRDKLGAAASAKEKQIQAEIAKEKPEQKDKPVDIVDETAVNAKFDAIEEKIKVSPIADKHKETIRGKLGKLVDTWKGKIDKVGKKAADKLNDVWAKTNDALAKFNERKDVAEIYQTLEPLYDKTGKPKAGIVKAMNLVTYKKGSGEWEKINKNLASAGFPEENIKPMQKMLGVKVDGRVDRETINAMSAMLGLTIKVDFAKETKYVGEEKSEEQKAAEANPKVPVDVAGAVKPGGAATEGASGGAGAENVPGSAGGTAGAESVPGATGGAGAESVPGAADEGLVAGEDIVSISSQTITTVSNNLASIGVNINRAALKRAYAETSSDKRIKPDAILAQIDRLVDARNNIIGDSEVLVDLNKNKILAALGYLVEGQEAKGISIIDSVIEDFEGKELEVLSIPEDFKNLNEKLGLSEHTLAIYYNAYLKCPDTNKISISKISEKMKHAEERFLGGVEKNKARKILIEIFGKLVNGVTEKLVGNETLVLNISRVKEKYETLGKKLKEKTKMLTHNKEVRDRQVQYLAKLVEDNPSFINFWTPSNENLITQGVAHFKAYNGFIAKTEAEISAIERERTSLLVSSFVNQHQLLTNNGQNVRGLLLQMDDNLEQKDLPEFMREEVRNAAVAVQHDPNSSEFDKLFYAGEYEKALQFLADQNRERTKVPGMSGHLGQHDYLASYRKYKGTKGVGKLVARWKGSDSFAGKKVNEGYLPIPINIRKDRRGQTYFQTILMKQNPDGSISHVFISDDGNQIGAFSDASPLTKRIGAVHTMTAEDIKNMDENGAKMQERVGMIINKSPSFKAISSAGADLNKTFAPMQALFQKSLEGNKTVGFVNLLKSQAREIKGSSAISNLRSNIKHARAELATLKSFGKGYADQFERKIASMEKQLSNVASLVESNKISNFCDHILSSDFSEDDFQRWIIKDGIAFLATILAATAAIVITVATFGAGGPLGLALVAGVGTLAGMAGNELGTLGSHYIGKEVYGEDFSNKTLLGKYLTNEKVPNPKTGELEEIKGVDVLKTYGKQAVVGFVTTYALLGLGQFVGSALSKFSVMHGSSSGAKGLLARAVSKLPRLNGTQVDILEKKGFGAVMRKIGKESMEEFGEEGLQTVAEKGHPALGFLASLATCLNGSKVSHKFGNFDVVQESVVNTGGGADIEWSYNASNGEAFTSSVKSDYGSQGFDVVTKSDGSIVATKSVALKGGKIERISMTFKPSNDSLTMRQTLKEGLDSNGNSEAQRLYGMKSVGENSYEISETSPAGKMGVAEFLGRRGFVINGDPESGTFEAVKGEEVVRFSANGKAETEAEVEAEAEKEQHDPANCNNPNHHHGHSHNPLDVGHDHDHEHGRPESAEKLDEHGHPVHELTTEAMKGTYRHEFAVAKRDALLNPKVEEGKVVMEALEGKTVEINGKQHPVDKRLLTPTTLKTLAITGKLELSSYDIYLHKTFVQKVDNFVKSNGRQPNSIEFQEISSKVQQGVEVFFDSHKEWSEGGRDIAVRFMHETVEHTFDEFAMKMKAEHGIEIDPEALNEVKRKIIEAGIDQHIDNPPQYVSHGFDHSLRVMDHVKKVVNSDPKVIENIMANWEITREQAELLTVLNGICHDFGYPDVGEGLGKAMHAVTGTYRFLHEIALPLAKASGLDMKNPKHKELMNNFARSIECHSADKVETSWKRADGKQDLILNAKVTVKIKVGELEYEQEILADKADFEAIKTKMKAYFKKHFNHELSDSDFSMIEGDFEGRHVDIVGSSKNDRTPGAVEYRPAELINQDSDNYDPLLAATRYADNLDMDPTRFSEFQRSPIFTALYTRMGAERNAGGSTMSQHISEQIGHGKTAQEIAEHMDVDSEGKFMYEGELFSTIQKIVENGEISNEVKIARLRGVIALLGEVEIAKFGSKPKSFHGEAYVQTISTEVETAIKMLEASENPIKFVNKTLKAGFLKQILEDAKAENPAPPKVTADGKVNLAYLAYVKNMSMVEKFFDTVNEESFRHFGGCNPIMESTMENGVIKIKMNHDVVKKYNGLAADEKGLMVPIAAYQVWRGVEAYESLSVGDRKAKFEIKIGHLTFEFDPETMPDGSPRIVSKAFPISSQFVNEFSAWQKNNI